MYKPGVRRGVHLFIAPFLWTGIGIMLLFRGYGLFDPAGRDHLFSYCLLLFLSFCAGTCKSFFILDKAFQRSIDRIYAFHDGTCLGAVFSWKTWLMAATMMLAGMLIRTWVSPSFWLSCLYMAVGWSMCFSSRLGWYCWYFSVNRHGFFK